MRIKYNLPLWRRNLQKIIYWFRFSKVLLLSPTKWRIKKFEHYRFALNMLAPDFSYELARSDGVLHLVFEQLASNEPMIEFLLKSSLLLSCILSQLRNIMILIIFISFCILFNQKRGILWLDPN